MLNLGVVMQQATVTYQNTSAKALFSLPAAAVPLFAIVQTETAFDDTGTDLLQIGAGSDADYFASGISVAAAGGQLIALNQSPVLTKQTQVTATYTGENGNAAAGRAKVFMIYANPFDPS